MNTDRYEELVHLFRDRDVAACMLVTEQLEMVADLLKNCVDLLVVIHNDIKDKKGKK